MADLFMTPVDLAAGLHHAAAPTIIDMRDDADAAADPRRIPGARAVQLADIETVDWPAGTVACCCQKGGKLSQLGAAILRARGVPAVALSGGHLDWVAGDLPLLQAAPIVARWVIPSDPNWSELAALWVLVRLVDRSAPVMAVTRDWLSPAAQAWSARAVPPTAEDMAEAAALSHPALSRLAGGPEGLLSGRLCRVSSPQEALDLIDDWLARSQVAA